MEGSSFFENDSNDSNHSEFDFSSKIIDQNHLMNLLVQDKSDWSSFMGINDELNETAHYHSNSNEITESPIPYKEQVVIGISSAIADTEFFNDESDVRSVDSIDTINFSFETFRSNMVNATPNQLKKGTMEMNT